MLFSRMNSLDHFVEGVVPKFVYKECLHTKIYWDIWNVNNSLYQCFSPKTMIGFIFVTIAKNILYFYKLSYKKMYLKNIFVFDSVISSFLNPFLMLEAEEGSVQMTSVKKKNGIVKKPTFRIFFSISLVILLSYLIFVFLEHWRW